METLYVKFGIALSESMIEETLWSYDITKGSSTLKFINLINVKDIED